MKYLSLSNGKKMSKLGLGVSRFGTRIPAELAEEMLARFCQAGGTLVDTARNYYEWVENGRGKSEAFLGAWMENQKCRDQLVVSTKGGVRNCGRVFIADLSRDTLLKELDESMYALRTGYLDIYLLHRDEPERPVEEIVESLQEIAAKADCCDIGVCNWSCQRIRAANQYAEKHGLLPIRVVQTWWSLASYTDEMWDDPTTTHMDAETSEYCQAQHCIVMGYTSQAKGFFQKACASGVDCLDPLLKRRILNTENLKKLNKLQEYCKINCCTPTDVVVGYITSNPLLGTALISCSNLVQLEDVLASADYHLETEMIRCFDEVGKYEYIC